MKIVVISPDYPGPDNIYGDVFVHTRLKAYARHCEVRVIGFNPFLKHAREYTYEGITAFVTSDVGAWQNRLAASAPDVIVVHFIHHLYMEFLLATGKPIVVFVHGFEATLWKRRLHNYDSITSLRYLLPYVIANRKQLRGLKMFINAANSRTDIQFIFVSEWLKNAVEEDLSIRIKNGKVIPNPIDTDLFKGAEKTETDRRKILLIRSFKARNYGNDISIDAILKLSRKPFFGDMQFAIYGEGYLFKPLTRQLLGFPNVTLHNYFVENKRLPEIHGSFGVFLCASRMDTQGVSMCEAMSSGLVPMTSEIGGIPEFVTRQSGFMTRDADELAEKIEYLYYHPKEFIQLSRQARNGIVEKCSLHRIVAEELQVILRSAHAPINT
jgi:L-malate glycosyltransferase